MGYFPEVKELENFFLLNATEMPDAAFLEAMHDFMRINLIHSSCIAGLGHTSYYSKFIKHHNFIEMVPKQFGVPQTENKSLCMVDPLMLPLRNESVDALIAAHILEYNTDLPKIFSELSRVIVNGGNLLITQIEFIPTLFCTDPIVCFSKYRLMLPITTWKYGFERIGSYRTKFFTKKSKMIVFKLILLKKVTTMAIPTYIHCGTC